MTASMDQIMALAKGLVAGPRIHRVQCVHTGRWSEAQSHQPSRNSRRKQHENDLTAANATISPADCLQVAPKIESSCLKAPLFAKTVRHDDDARNRAVPVEITEESVASAMACLQGLLYGAMGEGLCISPRAKTQAK